MNDGLRANLVKQSPRTQNFRLQIIQLFTQLQFEYNEEENVSRFPYFNTLLYSNWNFLSFEYKKAFVEDRVSWVLSPTSNYFFWGQNKNYPKIGDAPCKLNFCRALFSKILIYPRKIFNVEGCEATLRKNRLNQLFFVNDILQ